MRTGGSFGRWKKVTFPLENSGMDIQLAKSVEPIQGSRQSLFARAVTSALSQKESGIGGMLWPSGAAEPAPDSSS